MSAFAHLHVHSCYSFLEGIAEPARLVQSAQEQGMPALALTDHLSLCGLIEFYQACQKAAIQPILGMEINLSMPGRLAGAAAPLHGPLVLLAMDMSGWSNLCRLTRALLDDPEHDSSTTCSLEFLSGFSDGLICLTGGRRSLLSRLIRQGEAPAARSLLHEIRAVFPQRACAELQIHLPEDARIAAMTAELARQENLPTVATHDIYAIQPDQEDLQQALSAIRLNKTMNLLPPEERVAYPNRFQSISEMARRFRDFPGALERTLEVAGRCNLQLPLGVPHFPVVTLPNHTTPAALIRKKADAGARRLYGKITPEVRARLDHELEIITRLGFEPIFLIMEEILQWAHRANVPVSSRGSAASSLVAHCLGITSPDPLALDLYFERFLNPARATPPDIDTDICSRRRDLVIQHVFETYGQDRVAMVGTINRFRSRSALSDIAKAHGLSPQEVRSLVESLPRRWFFRGGSEEGEEDDIWTNPYKELESKFPDERHKRIFQQATAILGLPRHLSVHAGGVVITPGPLTDLLPVRRANKGITITQLDYKMLEPMGVVKLDLLGIRGLSVLGDVAATIQSWRCSEYASLLDVLEDIPLDDPQTARLIQAGQTIGCFQIESPGMRITLKEIHADSIEDVMIALALYRPGPLTGGLKDSFVRRHNGQEEIVHIHPALTKLLGDTYGVILYQEQVLRIAYELGGFSLAESDLLRRAMSHFDPGKQMQTLKEKFIASAAERSEVDAETATRIWELMAAFGGYGFPKAHAASYALIGWRSAWCKAHFPAEFMAAVLANWGGYYHQSIYLSEARRLGLRVRPPHINHSRSEFCVRYPQGEPVLYMGLDQVKGLTHGTQEQILSKRPFQSLEDFLVRANPRLEEASNLVRCGALDGLGTIPSLLPQLTPGTRRAGQLSLFGPLAASADQPDWSLKEKMLAQKEILGVMVEAHPLELVTAQVHKSGAIETVEAAARIGQRVRIAGIRQISHRTRTPAGLVLTHITYEDREGILDTIITPDVYRRFRPLLATSDPVLIDGVMERDPSQDEPVLRVERVILIK